MSPEFHSPPDLEHAQLKGVEKPTIHKTFQDIIRDLTDQAIAKDHIDPHEKEELKKLYENNLPPKIREEQRADRSQLDLLSESHKEIMDAKHTKYLLALTKIKDETISQDLREDLQATLDKELEEIKQLESIHEQMKNIVERVHEREAQAVEVAQVDKSTGLFTRKVLMDQFGMDFDRYLKGESIPNKRLSAIDLLNFKVGNDILTPSGFDLFFREMCKGYIGVSRELGDEKDTYGKLNAKDLECTTALTKYFYDKNNEKASKGLELLEELQQKGIKITMFRDKSGGDEAYFQYDLPDTYNSPEEEEADYQRAKDLVDYIMDASEIKRHEPESLEKIAQAITGFPEMLAKKSPALKDSPFLKAFPSYLDKLTKKLMTEEEYKISMGFAEVEGSFNEAVVNFCTGETIYGDPLLDAHGEKKQGLLIYDRDTQTYKLNVEHIETYKNRIMDKIKLRLNSRSLSPEEIQGLVTNAISEDIIGSYLQRKNDEVEKYAKPADKKALLKKALKGDMKSLYQVGALVKSGRLIDEFKAEEFVEIVQEVEQDYKQRLNQEYMNKEANARDPDLLDLFDQIEWIKNYKPAPMNAALEKSPTGNDYLLGL